ncbi:MAG: AAA family ATPase [Acidimicrobiales bacterium]|nr:AAA family ATPase [Acidimicrobiales bacterium]
MNALAPGAATMTVLFTDLVGSTALRSRVGDDQADALRREHDELLARVIAEHRGHVVKGLGDGIMAVFHAPSEGVAAAVAINRAIARRNRKAKEPMTLRMGISVGEVRVEGDDVFGTPVVESSRLCGKAGDDQILVSVYVKALAGSRTSVTYRELGELELKGLSEPLMTYEVLWWEAGETGGLPFPHVPMVSCRSRFVGRNLERFALADAWSRARAGRGPVVIISGDDGVGKSRLALEFARAQHDEGATVLYGRCQGEATPPFQPFVDALRFHISHLSDAQLPELLGAGAGELVRLVPELAGRLTQPEHAEADADVEQRRLFDAVSSWLSAISKLEPVVFVIDDAHLASPSTLNLLEHLVQTTHPLRLLILVTWAQASSVPQPPLASLLTLLRRLARGAEHIHLTGLDQRAVAAIVKDAYGEGLDQQAAALPAALASSTGGNPLVVLGDLDYLLATGQVSSRSGNWVFTTTPEQLTFPATLAEVIEYRLGSLGDAELNVLRVAAVIGEEFDLPVLRVVAGVDEAELQRALDAAATAGVICEVPGAHLQLVFAHRAIRDALLESADPHWLRDQHRRVADEIERQAGPGHDRYIFDLAYHYCAAGGSGGDLQRAVDFATAAANRSRDQRAHHESVGWYRTALELFERSGVRNDHRLFDVLVALGEAERRAGIPGASERFRRAAAIATARGDLTKVARVALAARRGLSDEQLPPDPGRREMLAAAVRASTADQPDVRARLLAHLAAELTWAPDGADRFALCDEALDLARRCGDRQVLAEVLRLSLGALDVPEEIGRRTELALELDALASALEDPALGFRAAIELVAISHELGERTRHDEWLLISRERAEALGRPRAWWRVLLAESRRAFLSGDLERAEQFGRDALAWSPTDPVAQSCTATMNLAIARLQGQLANHVAELDRSAASSSPADQLRAARFLADAGRLDRAHGIYAHHAAAGFSLPSDPSRGIYLVTIAYLCSVFGDAPNARLLSERLEPFAHRMFLGPEVAPAGAQLLAMLSATAGQIAEAERWFERAVTLHESVGGVLFAAESRLEWARVCHAIGVIDRARVLADQARSAGAAHRARGLEAQAQALLAAIATPSRAYGESTG